MAETIFIKYYEETDCLHGYGVERTVELTRQEAIERMAKAMCVRDTGISCDNCIYKNSNNCKTTLENWFIEDAEAALNAIAPIIPQEDNNER